MSVIRIAIIGHSYVRDIKKLSIEDGVFFDGKHFQIKYFFEPGSCFDFWLNWPDQLHECVEYNPDIIYTILGGNSLIRGVKIPDLKFKAESFFQILRNNLSKSVLIPCQVENRYLSTVNKFGTPPFAEYRVLRDKFNHALRKVSQKDYMCCIGGPGRLDNKEYYIADNIHLNKEGLELYFGLIIKSLNYVWERIRNTH